MRNALGKSAIGASRATMAAAIAMASQSWQGYAQSHHDLFVENGRQPYVIVNEDNKIVARNSNLAEAIGHELVTNATGTVRHEDFLVIQEMITEVRQRSLNGISDLQSAGLTFPVGLEEQLVGTENINEFQPAEQEMNPTNYGNNDTVFDETYTPNPITHSTFQVPWRQQGFAYKRSEGLKASMRQVAERLEETLFNGNSNIAVNFGGQSFPIYGYTTHPARGTASISDWSNVANNDVIVNEVISNVNQMFQNQGGVAIGRVKLYYPKNFKEAMDRDYKSGFPSKTVADRIRDIPEIMDIEFAEKLSDSEVMYVEMESRTVQLAVASDMVAVPHTKTNPMQPQDITTYAAMVQIIKVDSAGNTGLLHATVP